MWGERVLVMSSRCIYIAHKCSGEKRLGIQFNSFSSITVRKENQTSSILQTSETIDPSCKAWFCCHEFQFSWWFHSKQYQESSQRIVALWQEGGLSVKLCEINMHHYFVCLQRFSLGTGCFLVTLWLHWSDSCGQLFFSPVSKKRPITQWPPLRDATGISRFGRCHCSREDGNVLNPSSAIELLWQMCHLWPVTQDAKGQDCLSKITACRWHLMESYPAIPSKKNSGPALRWQPSNFFTVCASLCLWEEMFKIINGET